MSRLITEHYQDQVTRWPKEGRVILAQYDDESVVVYQAYRRETGHYAAEHGRFGVGFSLGRMSWIKPNFLWMMYRSGWGTKLGQEVTLAIRLHRSAFDEILARAVSSTYWRTLDIENISEFVNEQRVHVERGDYASLVTPKESAYPVDDSDVARRIGLVPETKGTQEGEIVRRPLPPY